MRKDGKMSVPRSFIPRIDPLCPKCGSGTKAVFGTPNADGYYRRHMCLKPECHLAFYSLASYVDKSFELRLETFPDRELTEIEVQRRLRMWDEHNNNKIKRGKVPLLHRMAAAMEKEEGERTDADTFLCRAYETIEKKLAALDASEDGDTPHERQTARKQSGQRPVAGDEER